MKYLQTFNERIGRMNLNTRFLPGELPYKKFIMNFDDDVKSAYSYVLRNSNSNESPYHNFYHILTVAGSCYEASKYYKMDKEDTSELLIAALFHDFNHTQGKEKDNVNIQIAIEGFLKWAEEFNYKKEKDKGQLNLFSSEESDRKIKQAIDNIINIIKSTEFPHKSSDSLTLSEQIIRDADMCQALQDNWIQQVIFGLGKEMKKSPKEMIDMQEGFFNNIKPYTEWFAKKWNSEKGRLLAELDHLKKIY